MPNDDLGTKQTDISGSMPEPKGEQGALILRKTSHTADVHFKNVWVSDFGEKKVGVVSSPEFSDIFSDVLNWDDTHHRWNSDRVKDTEMWEVDLQAVFLVASVFIDMEDVDVTIDEEVWREFADENKS